MKPFDFNQAYRAIVKASIEQDEKEIPLLLSSADFKDNLYIFHAPKPYK